MFNKFLRDMKTDFIGTRYSAFWDKVANESVSLITSSESEDSSVTQDEAKQVSIGTHLHTILLPAGMHFFLGREGVEGGLCSQS